MKYLKIYENMNNKEIKKGDWIALKLSTSCSDLYKYFLEMPCEVVGLDSNSYVVKLRCEKKEIWWTKKDIEFSSNNIKDVDVYIQSRKYNL